MSKPNFSRLNATWFLALCICFSAHRSHANHIIYSDNMNGSGALDGTAPQVGGNTWTAASLFTRTGSGTSDTNTADNSAWLPFTPVAGNTYTLTVSETLTGNGGNDENWFAAGFTPVTTNISGIHDFNSGPWMLIRDDAGTQVFGGPGTSNGANGIAGNGDGTSNTVSIVLDTRGSQWVASYFINGNADGTFTYAVGKNPTIGGVGISGIAGATGTFTSFTLTGTPEPSSLLLCGLGAIGLFFAVARRRSGAKGSASAL